MFPFVFATALCAAAVLAQSLTPANSTTRGSDSSDAPLSMGVWTGNGRSFMGVVDVVPLSDAAAANLPADGLRGTLLPVDPASLPNVTSQDIAYITCDSSAYPGNIDAVKTLASVVSTNVTAVLLYSSSAAYCNYTTGPNVDDQYPFIYSMTDSADAGKLYNGLAGYTGPLSMDEVGLIQVRSTLEASMNSSNSNGSSQGQDDGSTNSPLGPSPSTAVAMIILYSITGVITALFLVIIITGAVRAHRHPERYGPRDGQGRPRQSRARGLARAMLETIPIVKFGEREPLKPTDVELAEGQNADANSARAVSAGGSDQRPDGADTQPQNMTEHGSAHEGAEIAAATATAAGGAAAPTPPEPEEELESLGCSICTDDFERGQDIRVLPCDHKFHPACIDPWLLNVSGTCPLCRIDLRPTTSRDSTYSAEVGAFGRRNSHLAPPLEDGENPAATNRQSRLGRFGDLLNLRRNPDSTAQERIAALRRLRDRSPEGSIEDAADVRRRHRLTARLQDVFSVRTRREQSSSREDVSQTAQSGGEGDSSSARVEQPDVHETRGTSPAR